MEKFEALKELVKKKGFGSAQYTNVNGEMVYLSRGVREVFLTGEDREQKVIQAIGCFQMGDFGTAAAYGKGARPGHEYGRYELAEFEAAEDSAEDTGVWIHRTEDAIKVYFKFER